MKHREYTEAERTELEHNPHISEVKGNIIRYKQEFKEQAIYEQTKLGKSARQIFREAGIPDWLNCGKYAQELLKAWKHQDLSKPGRRRIDLTKPVEEMSIEELRKKIAYLELENEFLKKLEPLE